MQRLALFSLIRSQFVRLLSNPTTQLGEKQLMDRLRKEFPKASLIDVTDISGGCGAMFDVTVESEEFKGKNRVQQHRMVNEALKDEIKDMHGLRISTGTPKT